MRLIRCLLYLLSLGLASHLIGEALPRRWFCFDRFPYKSAGWEKDGIFYERLGIRRWKDKLPDMSRLLPRMFPKRASSALDAAGARRFLQETCVAECTHWALIAAGLGCLYFLPGTGGWLVFTLWGLGNMPFLLIQRYNRPRLARLAACYRGTKTQIKGEKIDESIAADLQYGHGA